MEEKVSVEISKSSLEFLKDLMSKVNTQDNRSTASPYYYVVRGVKKLTAADDRGCGFEYFDSDACESFTEDQLKQYCEENDIDFEEHKERCEKFNVQEVDEYVNVFFTYDGYKKHIELNGHNYRHFERFDSYVMHAFRNPEISQLMEVLGEISGSGYVKH